MKQLSHLGGCVGFWLWAFIGAAAVFGFVSFIGWLFWIPAGVLIFLTQRRAEWKDGPVVLGMITGAGFPLLVVAALNWNNWHARTPDNQFPNPYGWGGVGLALAITGIAAYAFNRRSG
jgi:hypothetical protein